MVLVPTQGSDREERRLITLELANQLGGEVVERTDGRLGRGESAHGVFFVEQRSSGSEAGERWLAVKLHRNSWKAAREVAALNKANQLGLKTLSLALNEAVTVESVDGAVVVTEQLAGLAPLTAIDWGSGEATDAGLWSVGDEYYQQTLAPLLDQTSRYLGRMHQFFVHGDLQLKNLGTIPTGEYVAFDLEGAIFRSEVETDQAGEFVYMTRCLEDILTYVKSLLEQSRYLLASSPQIFEQELQNNILLPYMEAGGDWKMLDQGLIEACCQLHQQVSGNHSQRSDRNAWDRRA